MVILNDDKGSFEIPLAVDPNLADNLCHLKHGAKHALEDPPLDKTVLTGLLSN